MAMQFYAPPEQLMRDRSEYARKGISRGRSSIVLSYADGVLLVAENVTSLHKISEIYDRIGFAAVGRYNEFENLRSGGVRMADLRGYSYDRSDVTARWLANAYAQTLGAIFTEQTKPFEVEICVAQVGATSATDELYRITYDGSVGDEHGFVAMGGQAEAISNVLKQGYRDDLVLRAALALAVKALGSVGGENGATRQIPAEHLEVAVLERSRPGRAFRRLTGHALTAALRPAVTEDAPAAVEAGPAEAGRAEEAPTSPEQTESTAADEPPADATTEPERPEDRPSVPPAKLTPHPQSGSESASPKADPAE